MQASRDRGAEVFSSTPILSANTTPASTRIPKALLFASALLSRSEPTEESVAGLPQAVWPFRTVVALAANPPQMMVVPKSDQGA